ncbi:MAG TPA: hypothetical protein VMM56_12860 [Planctomycetaceae bacterium]|nr:hypothetical protein [Planctomycetaceae bacterium]
MSLPINSMTTQEKVKNTELLVRELIQHLEMGFLPKLKRLSKVTRLGRANSKLEEIGDLTIRLHVSQVTESERFTETIHARLMELIEALEVDMQNVVHGSAESWHDSSP